MQAKSEHVNILIMGLKEELIPPFFFLFFKNVG